MPARIVTFAAFALASSTLAPTGLGQCSSQSLYGADTQAGDLFGYSISSGGDYAVVGASAIGSDSHGRAYIFEPGVGGWSQTGALRASDLQENDRFGRSVAAAGDKILVGAPRLGGPGAAYIFERGPTGWVERAKLAPPPLAYGVGFGTTVAFDGETAIVNQPLVGAYFFEQGPAGWELVHQAQFPQYPGSGAAVSGARALVSKGQYLPVAVFERIGGTWQEVGELDPGQVFPQFVGYSIAMSGDRAVVSVLGPQNARIVGRALVFEHNGISWVLQADLVPSDVGGSVVGYSVALEGDRVLIGAPYATPPVISGAVFLFERTASGAWVEVAILRSDEPLPGDRLGSGVALAAGAVVAGAPTRSRLGHTAGGIEVFRLSTSERYCEASANSTGQAARIRACGSHADGLTVRAAPVPDEPGLFFYGATQTLLPFGDGFRCVGGQLYRLAVENGVGGALEHAVDFSNPPTLGGLITPGSTWNFQAWFRDPAAGGAGFNLSDGLAVTF